MNPKETTDAIIRSFDELRGAIENRKYEELQAIIEDQRSLFKSLDFADNGSLELLTQAQDLTNWALTLAKVQHSHTERAYADVLRVQQVDRGYGQVAEVSAEVVRVRG